MKKISKILALETTDARGSVALSENGEIVAFSTLSPETRSARSLAPAIREILARADWRPTEIDATAVAVGPGSFTGLRVGVATAKMFAWSVGASIVGVDSLEAIASEVKALPTSKENDLSIESVLSNNGGAILSVGLDAQRGDVAVRRFWVSCDGSTPPISFDKRFRLISSKKWLNDKNEIEEPICCDWKKNEADAVLSGFDAFLNKMKANERVPLCFCGPALKRNQNKNAAASDLRRFVDEKFWNPTAIGVANVAWLRVKKGEVDDVWRILPVYSRKAAAEERLAGA